MACTKLALSIGFVQGGVYLGRERDVHLHIHEQYIPVILSTYTACQSHRNTYTARKPSHYFNFD